MFSIGRSTIGNEVQNLFRNDTPLDKTVMTLAIGTEPTIEHLVGNVAILVCKLLQAGIVQRQIDFDILDVLVLSRALEHHAQLLIFRKRIGIVKRTCLDIHTKTGGLKDIRTLHFRLGQTLLDNRSEKFLNLMFDIRRKQGQGESAVLQMRERVLKFTGRIGFARELFLKYLLEFVGIVEQLTNLRIRLNDIGSLNLVVKLTGIPSILLLATDGNLIRVFDVRPSNLFSLRSPSNLVIGCVSRSGGGDTVELERQRMNDRSGTINTVDDVLRNGRSGLEISLTGLLVFRERLKN